MRKACSLNTMVGWTSVLVEREGEAWGFDAKGKWGMCDVMFGLQQKVKMRDLA